MFYHAKRLWKGEKFPICEELNEERMRERYEEIAIFEWVRKGCIFLFPVSPVDIKHS